MIKRKTSARSGPVLLDTQCSTRTDPWRDPWPAYTKSYFAGIFFILCVAKTKSGRIGDEVRRGLRVI